MENRTKVICTIGPASEDPAVLRKMVSAGMDCVRLNFSHGTYAQFAGIISNIRKLEKELGRPIAIIQDLQGPKIRVGEVGAEGVKVARGEKITLAISASHGVIPVQYRNLPRDVHKDDLIAVDDGRIELTVLAVNATKTEIKCRVEIGGVIRSRKGINVPSASISAKPFTEKDRRDTLFGIRHGVDFVALSFVKGPEDVLELKRLLAKNRSRAKVIAKIERHEAMKNIDAIVAVSDAVMVARGDLGIEIPAETVPLEQKKIIHASNLAGKPVIVATEMLNSMVENSRPTRAEISDAANAIFDHADALMLSNETAVGKYPVAATKVLARVASAVEKDLAHHPHLLPLRREQDMAITDATCLNACKLAADIHAKFIVAITRTGYTVREIAKYRPFTPLIVFTPDLSVARQSRLVWGVTHTAVQFVYLSNPLPQIRKTLLALGLTKKGDEIVVCNAGFGRSEKLITTTVV